MKLVSSVMEGRIGYLELMKTYIRLAISGKIPRMFFGGMAHELLKRIYRVFF